MGDHPGAALRVVVHPALIRRVLSDLYVGRRGGVSHHLDDWGRCGLGDGLGELRLSAVKTLVQEAMLAFFLARWHQDGRLGPRRTSLAFHHAMWTAGRDEVRWRVGLLHVRMHSILHPHRRQIALGLGRVRDYCGLSLGRVREVGACVGRDHVVARESRDRRSGQSVVGQLLVVWR